MTVRWPSDPDHPQLDPCHCMYCGAETAGESVMTMRVTGTGTRVLLANVCDLNCLAHWAVMDLVDRARLEAIESAMTESVQELRREVGRR